MGRSLARLRPILWALAVGQQAIIGPELRLAATAKRDRKGELTSRHEAMRTSKFSCGSECWGVRVAPSAPRSRAIAALRRPSLPKTLADWACLLSALVIIW